MTAPSGSSCPCPQAQLDRALAGLLVALTPEEMRYIAGRDHGIWKCCGRRSSAAGASWKASEWFHALPR